MLFYTALGRITYTFGDAIPPWADYMPSCDGLHTALGGLHAVLRRILSLLLREKGDRFAVDEEFPHSLKIMNNEAAQLKNNETQKRN